MNTHEKLIESLKTLRVEAGLTQKQLAEKLGLHYSAVNRWEAGTTVPDIKTIVWYADYFDVSLDWIFGRKRTFRGNLRKLITQEVGDAIMKTMSPEGPIYQELEIQIGELLKDYGVEEENG